jgi:hypothetical protein
LKNVFEPRQSGGRTVFQPVRSVTLRPCLSAGLPFLCGCKCTLIIRGKLVLKYQL